MADFDPARLQEGKRRKAEERRQEREREEALLYQKDQAERQRMAKQHTLYDGYRHIFGYASGLYDEASKLSARRPTDPVSKLMVEQTNRAIRDTQELLADENDPFIGDIKVFVPAGDELPENRDVVLVLRQVKEALSRLEERNRQTWRYY